MKILCNFSTVYFHSLKILEILSDFSNKSRRLDFVPMDPEVISYLSATCVHRQVILTVTNEQEEHYCKEFIDFMQQCESDVSFAYVYNHNIDDEYIKETIDTIITNDLSLLRKYRHITNNVFVGNVFKCLWFTISFRGNKVVKNKMLNGLLSMPVLSLIEVFPYFLGSTIYMSFFDIKDLSSMSIEHFFSSILYCLFFKSFLELFYLTREWRKQQDLYEPRCSNQFIDGSSSVLTGVIYTFVFGVFSIIYAIKCPQGSLFGLFTGITYAISYNFSFTFRIIFSILTAIFSYLMIKI